MPSVNEELLDWAISHAHFVQRLKTGTGNDIVGFLDEDVFPDAVRKLEERLAKIAARGHDLGPATTKRLQKLITATNKDMTVGLRKARELLKDDLSDIALSEAEMQLKHMEDFAGKFGLEFNLPSKQQLNTIITSKPFEGALFKDHWGGLEKAARDSISRSLKTGMAQGETTSQIVRRVKGTLAQNFTDGDLAKIRRDVRANVSTAINHVNTQARDAVYQANDDIVKGWQFVATLDTRTTEICMSEDGNVFDVGTGPMPPLHFNCRSTTIPVLKSWKELGIPLKDAPLGTRASMNGQVPAKETYGTWLKKQPVKIQNEALGVGKAKLFRSGKVAIDKFVDNRRRPISLGDLRKNEGLDKPA